MMNEKNKLNKKSRTEKLLLEIINFIGLLLLYGFSAIGIFVSLIISTEITVNNLITIIFASAVFPLLLINLMFSKKI